eukprot:1975131-Rhodomonas_salina.5
MAARVGMRDAMGKLLVAASMLAVCQIVHGHGHSHSHSHSHGHDADHGHSHELVCAACGVDGDPVCAMSILPVRQPTRRSFEPGWCDAPIGMLRAGSDGSFRSDFPSTGSLAWRCIR